MESESKGLTRGRKERPWLRQLLPPAHTVDESSLTCLVRQFPFFDFLFPMKLCLKPFKQLL